MIRQTIYVERYDWIVRAYIAATSYDAKEILSVLEDVGINAVQFMRAKRHIQHAALNSGVTYSSPEERISVMVVSGSSSVEEAFNTFSHELRHVTDDIAEACGIETRGEEVAYLTGDIALALAGGLLKVVCDCPVCSHKD